MERRSCRCNARGSYAVCLNGQVAADPLAHALVRGHDPFALPAVALAASSH